MTRLDLDAIRQRCEKWEAPLPTHIDATTYEALKQLTQEIVTAAHTDIPDLLAHVDALEAALKREIGRCNDPGAPGYVWCCRAPRDYKCPAHRAALALLDGEK